jgi:sigma-B regulation protein RsbU (phosphoserine phosphatase)
MGRMEILTGVERRRDWSDEEKLSILQEAAISHGSSDGTVEVRACQDETALELTVSNEGTPIPTDVIATLFAPFTREDTRPSQQGLGLGLYISSEIAKAHGGTLTAISDERRTSFTLMIPAR